jgi:hypothetical protein
MLNGLAITAVDVNEDRQIQMFSQKVNNNEEEHVQKRMLVSELDLEVENVAVDFSAVDFRVRPLYTVAGFFGTTIIHQFQQFFIAADITFFDSILNVSIILNPQNYIPSFIISPTVVGLVGEAGLVGCGHLLGLVGMNQL